MKLNNGRVISQSSKPYFIAEFNTSHFGSVETSKEMIDAAIEVGCDCVKFQSWNTETLYSDTYYKQNPISKRFVKKFSLSPKELKELAIYAESKDIGFASTPYSEDEVDFLLNDCKAPFIKIASMEINNIQFLRYIARTKSAIILSTGMADFQEIEVAVEAILAEGNENLTILHCVSIYPAEPEITHLNNLITLKNRFPSLQVGYSDHTIGFDVPVAAVALGATIIEKHFTLDSSLIGMDNQMAMEPAEFKKMITSCNISWASLGSFDRHVSKDELDQRINMRRSIVSKVDIKSGQTIKNEDIQFKRPGDGFPPTEVDKVVGRQSKVDISADTVIYPDLLE